MDEDETPKKKQVSTLKSTNTSMNSVLDKLERVDLSVLSPEAVIKAQYFIIQYLKVIFLFPLFTWNNTKAELPQEGILFRTQSHSLGIFINKKVGFLKS